ncbi:MAG: serine/threonine protein kinase [Verrucomicrobiales bacterium]|jgi:serine/threonine protein kinase
MVVIRPEAWELDGSNGFLRDYQKKLPLGRNESLQILLSPVESAPMPENPSNHHCKRCGEAIATASPTGLCPGCMFGGALGLEPSEALETDGVLDPFEPSSPDSPNAPDPLEGTCIGRYKILQRIGEGGFGLVYMAEQVESVHRKVAVKVIKAGMDTKQVIARFEAERQALAMMDHPNIARFLDVGETTEGRPYFVMELVKGMPITQYCREKKLTTEARIDLFIQVCRAVQHAHVKGIIHRDLKPANILITLQDGQAIPKVIDFGIAKAMDQRLTDKTLFTRFEHMMGTPAYMSPEQVALRPCKTINYRNRSLLWMYLVVPFAVEFVSLDVDLLEFLV